MVYSQHLIVCTIFLFNAVRLNYYFTRRVARMDFEIKIPQTIVQTKLNLLRG